MKYIVLILSVLMTQLTVAQDYPEVIPEFEIFTLEGDAFTNENVQNETYSLFIYFNPECSHCRTTFEALNLKAEEIGKANVTLYPISTNTEEITTAFFKELNTNLYAIENIEVLRDDDYKFADMFFVGGYPTSYLYDNSGKLVKVYNGTTETVSFMEDLR